jgi:hypothetical protein
MAGSIESSLWRRVDGLLARAEIGGIVAHKLGPLAAYRLRRLDRPVPAALESEEQLARMAVLTAIPLLRRIRDLADGPLVLVKGAEVASLYPGRARSFSDLDLFAVQGHALHESLKAAGFSEVKGQEMADDYRHLPTLEAPRLWLKVEIHTKPIVPDRVPPPPLEEVVEASIPSALGVEGISAPHPVHHALMLAAHGWDDYEPLSTLRDLIDVAAVSQHASDAELARTARAWGVEGIWRTTHDVANALFAGGRQTAALRLLGRHLPDVRERTVLDNHLQRWLHPYWELPFHQALLATPETIRAELFPEPGESWKDKLQRVKHALLRPGRSMSTHTESWRREATGTRDRQVK